MSELIYSSDHYQVYSHGGGKSFEIHALTDREPITVLRASSARELATALDAYEQQAGSDARFTRDVDRFLSQYFI